MTKPRDDAPKTVQDLARVTGLDPRTVRTAIRVGELPGYAVGSRYVVPADAFAAFCRGEWQPQPRPLFPHPVKPLPQPEQLIRKSN